MNSLLHTSQFRRASARADSFAIGGRATSQMLILDVARMLDWIARVGSSRYRRPAVVLLQLALVALSQHLAFWLRFEGAAPLVQQQVLQATMVWQLAIRGAVFAPFRLYGGIWQFTGLSELCSITMAVALSSVLSYGAFIWLLRLPYSEAVVVIDSLLLVGLLSGVRLCRRVVRMLARRKGSKRLLIYGAGGAGEMILRDMQNRPYEYEPLAFLDDEPAKVGQWIHGVRVLGGRGDLARIVAMYQPHEVLVAMPSASLTTIQAVVRCLEPFKVPITTLPGVRDVLDGRVAVTQIRELTIADLLPRAPIDLNSADVQGLISGRRVLVTGAGGSIGTELSTQIAAFEPAMLVLFERYENTLHDVSYTLRCRYPTAAIHSVIGDVTDPARVHEVMGQFAPHLVFHAAAHKHVPLMEHNPCEAIKNNVIGTATVAAAAARAGVERFILISTDKAVNPSSVMGATKRVAEVILQMESRNSATRFATVRFGNVLGSNGSVLPRFLEQIKAGGPVTVTHPEIRRYFMLISEAVQLVLHAATLGEPGTTYVLEMGEQIRLVDLARNLIQLSGHVPDKEIGISFVGLRPGEKLFEELVSASETAEPSRVPKILRVRGTCEIDRDAWSLHLSDLILMATHGDATAAVAQLRRMVPTFQPDDHIESIRSVAPVAWPAMSGRLEHGAAT